jgi:hypothetical protein
MIGAGLAHGGEFIGGLSGYALQRGDSICAYALVRLRMPGTQAQIALVHGHCATRIRHRAAIRHHFGAASDDQILHAGHDGGSGKVYGGEAGSAKTVERYAACAHVIAGVERRHAAEVAALFAALAGRAPDDVVHVGSLKRVAVGERAQHASAKLLRMDVRERAAASLADASRRAARIDNIGLGHEVPSENGDRVDGRTGGVCYVKRRGAEKEFVAAGLAAGHCQILQPPDLSERKAEVAQQPLV